MEGVVISALLKYALLIELKSAKADDFKSAESYAITYLQYLRFSCLSLIEQHSYLLDKA